MKDYKFWTYKTFNNKRKYNKRFVVYLYKWWYGADADFTNMLSSDNDPYKSNDYADFDTMEEVNEHVSLIEEIYKDIKKPETISEHWVHRETGKVQMKEPNNRTVYKHINKQIVCDKHEQFFWGYMILDYQEEKILKFEHDIHPEFYNYKKDMLKFLDIFFRKPGEVPENYKWDVGEYEGWLQFRWGNGLNAIEVEDELNRKKQEKELEERKRKREERKDFEEENKELLKE